MTLRIVDVTKSYGRTRVLKEISFELDKPQMVGIIGRSGAGKSTLLRILNRLTEADSGAAYFDGEDVLSLRGSARRRWQAECAMVFQQFNLVPRLDVMTNVLLGRLNRHSAVGSMLRLFSREERLQAVGALQRLGILEHANKRAERLSGGQQQRVAIARALTQGPKVVLADEPIASLDPMNATLVMDALRKIHDEDGLTVICNLHTLDTARTYCDRVIGLRAGELVFDGPGSALTAQAAKEIYGVDGELNEAATSTSLGADHEVRTPEQLAV